MTTSLAIDAVLLDIGGVFHLPDPGRISAACALAEHPIDAALVPKAHYAACAVFDHPGDAIAPPWGRWWPAYLSTFATALGISDERVIKQVLEFLADEFTTAGLWEHEIEGSRAGLQALADTGVRLGIVSNNDGEALARLRAIELAQVGAGIGVNVECVIDSGAVGIEKPDPRIFELALISMQLTPSQCWYVGDMPGIDAVGAARAGIRPFIVDPFCSDTTGTVGDVAFDRITSLSQLAAQL